MAKPTSHLTITVLSNLIADVLQLPHYHRSGKSSDIVRVIIHTMASALQRGEEVSIAGLGKFKVVYIPPRKRKLTYLWFQQKPGTSVIQNVKEKFKVVFKPSKSLQRYVNEKAQP